MQTRSPIDGHCTASVGPDTAAIATGANSLPASRHRRVQATASDRVEPFEYFGCGFHESSWELLRGVQVQEDLSFEAFELFIEAQGQAPLNSAS